MWANAVYPGNLEEGFRVTGQFGQFQSWKELWNQNENSHICHIQANQQELDNNEGIWSCHTETNQMRAHVALKKVK